MTTLFEWDEEKADTNLQKHGISFDEAQTVFADPLAIGRPAVQNGNSMKKKNSTKQQPDSYDFSGGVQGKYHSNLQQGFTIRIYKKDGSVIEKQTIEPGTVTLEPDVREYFPTSKAVNRALRTLISIMPRKSKAASSKVPSDKGKRNLVARNSKNKRKSLS